MWESSERAFEAYREPIKKVLAFKYLGRVLTAGDNNWLAVVGNMGKARRSSGWLSQVLCLGGIRPEGVEDLLYSSRPGGTTL